MRDVVGCHVLPVGLDFPDPGDEDAQRLGEVFVAVDVAQTYQTKLLLVDGVFDVEVEAAFGDVILDFFNDVIVVFLVAAWIAAQLWKMDRNRDWMTNS